MNKSPTIDELLASDAGIVALTSLPFHIGPFD